MFDNALSPHFFVDMHSTPYEILGIPPNAAPDAIRTAHRRITEELRSRSTSSPEAAEIQRAADEAVRILSNPTLRAFYDQEFRDQIALYEYSDNQAPSVAHTAKPDAHAAQGLQLDPQERRGASEVLDDWATARPYFFAAIAGKDHDAPFDKEAAVAVYRLRQSIRMMPLLGFPFGAAAGFFVFGGPSLEKRVVFALLGGFLGFALVFALAAFAFHFCMPGQIRAERRSAAAYYLEKFRLMHSGSFGGFNFAAAGAQFLGLGFCWLLMRRMNGLAVAFGILTILQLVLIAYLVDFIPQGTPAAKQIHYLYPSLLAVWMLVFGFFGNRWYYNRTTKAIRRVAHAPPVQAQSLLAIGGGQRRGRALALGAFVVSLPILSLMLPADEPDRDTARAKSPVRSPPAMEALPLMQKPSTRTDPKASSEQLISDLEYQYPQLDPQSSHYDEALVKTAVDLIAQFQQRGYRNNEAIVMAVEQLQASGRLHARR